MFLKDKWVLRFYVFLIFVIISIYYAGETRNRRLRELGFEICEKRGMEVWSTSCPEKDDFLSREWGK